MWGWIQPFWTAHAKTILTVGFGFGVLSLIVQFLDQRIPESSKRQFNARIEEVTIILDDLTFSDIYGWSQKRKKEYIASLTAVYTAVGFTLWFRNNPSELQSPIASSHPTLFFMWIIGISLFVSCFLAWALYRVLSASLSKQSATESAKHYWKKALKYTLYQVLFFILVMFVYWCVYKITVMNGNPWPYRPPTFTWALTILAVASTVQTIYGVLFSAPLVLIVALRAPLAAATRFAWWLVNFHNGAWAGLVFILTIVLGIFRLFL